MGYDAYRALPEGAGYDLLGGLCFREPMPTVDHQLVVDDIVGLLRRHARRTGVGRACREIDVHLDAENCPAPDVAFISTARLPMLNHHGLHGIAPDLCAEVLSPRTARRDRGAKADLYARYGCREYWLVDPEEPAVEVLRPGADGAFDRAGRFRRGELFDCAAVPGLRVAVAEVFADDGLEP